MRLAGLSADGDMMRAMRQWDASHLLQRGTSGLHHTEHLTAGAIFKAGILMAVENGREKRSPVASKLPPSGSTPSNA